jgi:hypothetical protein
VGDSHLDDFALGLDIYQSADGWHQNARRLSILHPCPGFAIRAIGMAEVFRIARMSDLCG